MKTQIFFAHAVLVLTFLFAPFGPAADLLGDAPNILIDPIENVETSEDGTTAQLSVVLDFPPLADVILSVQSSDMAEGTVSPAELIFTPEVWDTPQFITLTGQPDEIDDGDQVYAVQISVTSDDPGYAALTIADIEVINRDVDTAGVDVDPASGLQTAEDGTFDTFSVVLTSRPAEAVTIQAVSQTPSEAAVSPASIPIAPDDWDQPVIFTVSGVADGVVDDDAPFTIALSAASADALYDGISLPDVIGVNRNLDEPVVLVAIDDTYPMDEDVPLSVAAPGILDNDTGSDALSVNLPLVVEPAVGDLDVLADGSFHYTPPANYSGTVTFQYRATDGIELSNAASVTIEVSPVNDPPIALPESYITRLTSLTVPIPGVLTNDSDIDDVKLHAVLLEPVDPAEGSVTLVDGGSFTFTAASGFEGTAFFTYRAYDEEAYSQPVEVTITVDRTPPAAVAWTLPVGTEQTYSTTGGDAVLQVTAPADAVAVEFYRWDHKALAYVDLEIVDAQPYAITIDTSTLPIGQNQIFARCLDAAGNRSDRRRIIINLQPNLEPQAYLPFIVR